MAKTVGITGATGFLGRHLALSSLKKGYNVRCLVRDSEYAKEILGDEVETIECSLDDIATLKLAIRGCDLLIHAAALHTRKLTDRDEIFRVNVKGTRNLIESVESLNAFLFVSSIRSMMTIHTSYIDEDTRYDFFEYDTPYGYSKFKAENICFEYMNNYNLPLYIINPAVIIGPEDIRPSYNGQLILNHLKRRVTFVTEAMWNIVDVRDVVDASFFVLENGKIGERHIVSSVALTLKEFFLSIDEVSGQRKVYISVPYIPLKIAGWGFEVVEKIFPLFNPPIVSSGAKIAGLMTRFSGEKLRRMGFDYRDVKITFHDTVQWFLNNQIKLKYSNG